MYQPEQESMARPALEALQLERLQKLLATVYDRVPLYRTKFDEAGFNPASLTSLDDLRRVPFTVKDDMRSAYPYEMFAAPLRDIVRVHSSSGTTGQITVVGYTKGDIERWSDLMARTYASAGATPDDVVQVTYGYGLFTGGLGAHYGSERLGALTVPVSGGNTKRQVQILKDFGVTVLACTPSYAVLIGETALEMGIDPKSLPLRIGVFGAEPWSENMRRQIEDLLGVTAIDIYGLSEVMGPGVASECVHQNGLHVFEDHFLIEIIDPETLEPVPDGEYGEVVFTTLTKEGIPIVRYRTRDISRIIPEPCLCGRTFRRMERITGRTDDMLIIRGVNVFPNQIEQVLAGIPGVARHYEVVLTKKGALDDVEVRVEVAPDFSFDEVRELERLQRTVRAEIQSALAISLAVKLVEPKSIARSEGKAKRVVDLATSRRVPEMIQQLSVFLENSTGRLGQLTRTLGDAGINMHALMIADTEQFGVVRIIADSPHRAKDILDDLGFSASLTPVVAVEVPDRPGGLADVVETLGNSSINIEYAYCFVEPNGQAAIDVFKIDNADAEKVLAGAGFRVLTPEDLYAPDAT